MKIITYYLLLLVALALIIGYLFAGTHASAAMSMPQMLGISIVLGLYAVVLSLVGEGKTADEREAAHRYISNRAALVTCTAIISLGVIVQLFVSHHLDYWLLASLIALNLAKIISLIYLNYKK